MIWRRLLVPFFLTPLDRRLRNNQPLIWRTRVHVILFYSLVPVNILLYFLGRFREVDLAHIPTGSQLVLHTIGFLFAGFLFFAFWAGDQQQIPLRKKGWRVYVATTGLYWLCLLSFGMNILVYITPVINRTASLLPPGEVDYAYQIDQQWYACRRCDCPEEVTNRATPDGHLFMLQLAVQMGYDTLKEESCSYVEPNRVYVAVEDGYLSRTNNFHNRIVSLHNAQAFVRRQGTYYQWFYRLFPMGLLLFGWLGAQFLYLGSIRGSRPRREREALFSRRDLLDLWVIGRLDHFLLRYSPWWWNVQLHRWLFYVLFWGNAVLLMLVYNLPLRLGNLVDDLVPFALVLLAWLLGGFGWFIGWVYDRSLRVVVRKDPGRNLLLVLGYILAFYALLFNVGVFCTALAHRLDRLLPSEQLMQDLRYRLDNQEVSSRNEYDLAYGFALTEDAPLVEWRTRDGFQEYYSVKGSYGWTWAQRLYRLKKTAETVFASSENIPLDSIDRMLLKYAAQLVHPARLAAIPEVAPKDSIIGDSLRQLNEILSANMTIPEGAVDSVLSVISRPLEKELEQLKQIHKGGPQADSLGQTCLDWRIEELAKRREELRGDLQQAHQILTALDNDLIQTRHLPSRERLSPADSIEMSRLLDTLSAIRHRFLAEHNLPQLSPGVSLDDFLLASPEYNALLAGLEPLETGQRTGGYRTLARPEKERLVQYRIDFLRNEMETMLYNRYRIEQELRVEQTATVEGEIKWLQGLEGPADYFNDALFLFINRRQENAMAQRHSPADRLAEIERQAATLAKFNTRYLDKILLEMPFDPCQELKVLESRDDYSILPELERQEEIDAFDFACRYHIQEDSRLARLISWSADRLLDTDLKFQFASKVAPAWAVILEAKNFRYGQGMVFNLLTLYIPLYALPFVLTYIFLAVSFYYFTAESAGVTALGTLFFFVFLSLLPNRFFLEDPTWAYLLIGGATIGYGFFYRGNRRWLDYLALAWFLCSPLFLITVLTDRWPDQLAQEVAVDPYSLATEPTAILWLIWLGYLTVNLIIVVIGGKVFARQAYLPA